MVQELDFKKLPRDRDGRAPGEPAPLRHAVLLWPYLTAVLSTVLLLVAVSRGWLAADQTVPPPPKIIRTDAGLVLGPRARGSSEAATPHAVSYRSVPEPMERSTEKRD